MSNRKVRNPILHIHRPPRLLRTLSNRPQLGRANLIPFGELRTLVGEAGAFGGDDEGGDGDEDDAEGFEGGGEGAVVGGAALEEEGGGEGEGESAEEAFEGAGVDCGLVLVLLGWGEDVVGW